MRPGILRFVWLAVAAALLLPSVRGSAANPSRNRPELGVVDSSKWIRAKKLSDIAGWIKLRNPSGSDDEPIVVHDNNVRELARSGWVSGGSSNRIEPEEGAARSPRTVSRSAPAEEAPDWRDQYAEQRRKVAEAEARLRDYDSWRASRSSPYAVRGQVRNDPGAARREEMAREVEAERRKLADIHRRARREGVYIRR
jgi:hypothetical protein